MNGVATILEMPFSVLKKVCQYLCPYSVVHVIGVW